MEKNVESLRHTQAKLTELEKTNKRLYEQGHEDKKEVIKLKEEVEILKVKVMLIYVHTIIVGLNFCIRLVE